VGWLYDLEKKDPASTLIEVAMPWHNKFRQILLRQAARNGHKHTIGIKREVNTKANSKDKV
jgi:hypothetical protein